MNALKDLLAQIGRSQADLAKHLNASPATVSLIVTADHWPKSHGGKKGLQERIRAYLLEHGATAEMAAAAFNEAPAAPRANARRPAMAQATDSGPQGPNHTEDVTMLLRHSRLSREARAHFQIARDPFVDEIEADTDVFLTDDIRYVRGAMRQTAKHGGMLAVIAESGGGKSTLRHDLLHWINVSGEPITTIQVAVLGIDDKVGDRKGGRALTASDIIVSLVRTLSPGTPIKQTHVDRAEQVETVLRNSARVGRRHVMLIEEAHSLTKASLKQLKRFYELQDGFRKLLSIILVGQPELKHKLSETDPEVREVVQRMELVELPPLDNHVETYLRHKFARVELDYDKLCADDVASTIRDRLRVAQTEYRGGQRAVRERSLCHPLAVNNLVTSAMNAAVKIGAPKVTGALIASVLRAE